MQYTSVLNPKVCYKAKENKRSTHANAEIQVYDFKAGISRRNTSQSTNCDTHEAWLLRADNSFESNDEMT